MKKQRKYTRKGIVSIVLACTLALGMTVSNMPNIVTDGTAVTVEAASKKKDKKKPVITMKGKSKMTVTKGKSVKIPKVTAKDNKDGNVTKKIKVTVKKGKKSFTSIAKKIKNNKKVKFTATGKYTITYTVTDKSGNKTSKKRYVTVKNPPKKTTTEEQTTEERTTEEQTTEETTADTTEEPTEEKIPTDADYIDYKYKTSTTEIDTSNATDDIKITFENDYRLYASVKSPALKDCSFIKYFGKITATDAEGNDISDSIVIDISQVEDCIENYTSLVIYVTATDSNGNIGYKTVYVNFIEWWEVHKNAKIISSTTNFYGVLLKDII